MLLCVYFPVVNTSFIFKYAKLYKSVSFTLLFIERFRYKTVVFSTEVLYHLYYSTKPPSFISNIVIQTLSVDSGHALPVSKQARSKFILLAWDRMFMFPVSALFDLVPRTMQSICCCKVQCECCLSIALNVLHFFCFYFTVATSAHTGSVI